LEIGSEVSKMVIVAPTKVEKPLFKAELEYIPIGNKKPEKASLFSKTSGIEPDDVEIRERLRGYIVEVGKPESYNLKEMYEIQEIKPPVKIQMLFRKYDFWLIESPISFMPSSNTHFEQARVLVKMESLLDYIEEPIVHDAYPNNISEEIKENHKVSIELGLKFAEIIEPKAQYVDEIEFTRLKPVIEVAGIGTSQPIWDFSENALSNHKDAKTLYTIVKTPQGTEGMNISFFLYAEVPTIWGSKLLGKESKERSNIYKIIF
jgi:hypothetical protein